MRENKMNLNEYLIENGTALDKVSGDTYPVYVDGGVTFDDRDKMNIMEMEINGDSYEWFEALSDTDKSAVDDVMVNLSYEELVLGNK